MSPRILALLKTLVGFGIALSLLHLNVIVWESDLVFAEINEENESPVEDETCAEFVITLHGGEGLTSPHLFLDATNDDLAHMDRLSGHFEIDSPPPEWIA